MTELQSQGMILETVSTSIPLSGTKISCSFDFRVMSVLKHLEIKWLYATHQCENGLSKFIYTCEAAASHISWLGHKTHKDKSFNLLPL